ncbi:MAG: metallophosphoesterase, partial [Cyanobacteria bacterium]|nr:metallophosphoesterase [Cyanobacteriota bacterium]MDW8202114.1 metallophosphoesterase [Cyanobacteriota bacterium SKYGB_h_bin112]
MTSPITLVQLTDTHLVPMSISRLRGFPTKDSLAAVLAAIQPYEPDYLLLTGDLADAGDWEAYQQLVAMITPLGIPCLWLPGNHDLYDRLAQTLNQPPFDARKSLTIGQWRLILLNSVITTNCIGTGQLSASTLAWLHQELQAHSTHPTLIALHHHPLPTHIDWLDQISLLEPDTFLAM